MAIERPYAAEGEALGIYAAWEWHDDLGAQEKCGQLIRLFLGSRERGPEAQYDALTGRWYALTGHGNHGNRHACGGTWRSAPLGAAPDIFLRLEAIMDEQRKRIERANTQLKIANLRIKAQGQRELAAAYERQAMRPIYEGQGAICISKAAMAHACADRTLAEADVIAAKAGLA